METGRWNGHVFEVSPDVVNGFSNLTIKGSSETKEKVVNKTSKYTSRSNARPLEITLEIRLHAAMGVDVRSDALAFVNEAKEGAIDYFYVGTGKLVTCKLMLVVANVDDIQIAPNGTWVTAKVSLTMSQASKDDGSTSNSSGSKKSSTKKSSTKKTSTTKSTKSSSSSKTTKETAASKAASIVKGAVAAVKAAQSTVSTAKKNSAAVAAKKKTSGGGKGGAASYLVR